MQRTTLRPRRSRTQRRGSAAVEFALIAPVFVALFLGSIQSGINIDATHKLYAAVRQAGRIAGMDYSEKLQQGQTGNAKVIQDVKNQLSAEGIPGNKVTVTITHAEGANAGSTFDLSDSANDLKMFKIKASVPYSDVNNHSFYSTQLGTVSASIVFRKGKNSLIN